MYWHPVLLAAGVKKESMNQYHLDTRSNPFKLLTSYQDLIWIWSVQKEWITRKVNVDLLQLHKPETSSLWNDLIVHKLGQSGENGKLYWRSADRYH